MKGLTETHATAVKAIATMVERKLEEMENCLLRTALNARGVRIHHDNDLREEEVKSIQENIDLLYKLLDQFCVHYEIPKEIQSLKKELKVKAGFLWEELSDATGRKFHGYGEEGKAIKEEYDRRIAEMIGVANNIIYNSNQN